MCGASAAVALGLRPSMMPPVGARTSHGRATGEVVEAYLATLPRGLASYPQCTSKASSIAFQLARRPTPPDPSLPAEVCEVLTTPPLPNAWLPTTVFVATTLAMGAHHGISFETLSAEATSDMVASPLYSLTLRMLSPSMLLRAGAATWGLFHRGATMVVREVDGHYEARLSFPTALFPEHILRGFARSFQTIIVASGTPDVRVALASFGSTFGVFRAG